MVLHCRYYQLGYAIEDQRLRDPDVLEASRSASYGPPARGNNWDIPSWMEWNANVEPQERNLDRILGTEEVELIRRAWVDTYNSCSSELLKIWTAMVNERKTAAHVERGTWPPRGTIVLMKTYTAFCIIE